MILAIANHTFREAIRKKILHVLFGLGVFIVIISPFMPTTDEPDARIKMAFIVFFQVVALLCILGIIFLSATALPYEIEDRTIYGILSKPVSRIKIILGKAVGFSFLSAFLLGILSLIQVFFVWQAASKTPEKYRGVLKARNEFRASQFSVRGKSHHVREGIVWIEGGRAGVAVWNFLHLPVESGGTGHFEANYKLKIESSSVDVDTIPLIVKVADAVSGEGKTNILSAKMDEPLTVEIASEIIQKSGSVEITAFPLRSEDYIGVTPDDVKLFSVQNGFAVNYAKAIGTTFLKFLLMAVIAVTGSTYLSAPVSIVSALFIFLCGHILDFFKDFSLLLHRSDMHDHSLLSEFDKPGVFFEYLDFIIKKPLEALSVILPDFKKFDSLKFLLKGVDIPLETVGFLLGYTAMYVSICLFISFILFKRREIL